jgi:hypothetical protein
MKRRFAIGLALFALSFSAPIEATCQEIAGEGLSLETSAIDPFFSIYFLRCHIEASPKDAFLFGAYYLYSEKTFSGQAYPGTYSGFAPIVGYRRFLWNRLYLEYQLFPMYADYRDSEGRAEAEGFELWNELHLGYRLDFRLGGIPLFLNLQGLVGICLLKTDEPPEFRAVEESNPAFYFPNFYVLPNLLLGLRLL